MIMNHNRTQTAFALFIMKIGLVGAVLMSTLLIARFALKMFAVTAGDVASLIFNVTEIIVQPFAGLVSPLTFSSGAMVETSSLLSAIMFVMVSGMFLWRLYLYTCEPLQVRSVHVTPI